MVEWQTEDWQGIGGLVVSYVVALRVVLCEGEDLLGLWQIMGDRGVEWRGGFVQQCILQLPMTNPTSRVPISHVVPPPPSI